MSITAISMIQITRQGLKDCYLLLEILAYTRNKVFLDFPSRDLLVSLSQLLWVQFFYHLQWNAMSLGRSAPPVLDIPHINRLFSSGNGPLVRMASFHESFLRCLPTNPTFHKCMVFHKRLIASFELLL